MPSFLVVVDVFVLQYILEPSKILYFVDDIDDKLRCTENKITAYHFYNRDNALKVQNKVKIKYGLEFQIVRL